MAGRAKPESRLATCEKRYRELAGKLAEVGFVMSGSVTLRYTHCGSQAADAKLTHQPHGPCRTPEAGEAAGPLGLRLKATAVEWMRRPTS